jgi:hypothetical protein
VNFFLRHILFGLLLLCSVENYAQISPGKLSSAHAELEGMNQCTKCHNLGDKVSNKKCLSCHKEIQKLITKKRGYHSSSKVIKQDCFKCHSEHHGRKFDMVRFDQDNFDHKQTSYILKGKHKKVDCKKCHTSEYIANPKIRKNKKTFLGLEKKCLSCHDDYHQKTLSNKCASCHDMKGFKPASKFDHDKTKYKLQNKHAKVECKKCHKSTTRNGKEFQVFTNIGFTDCKACHSDPHKKRIKGKCKQCHTTKDFSSFIGRGRFNHNTTSFKLKGKHKRIDCFTCHDHSSNAQMVFGDKNKVDENNCSSCHKDVHAGKFGNECAKCHNEKSFSSLRNMDFFDHTQTDYSLEGKHVGVDCKACHKGKYTDPIDFKACKNCHEDYHKEEFKKDGVARDCKECHSLQHQFDFTLFTLEQHQKSEFPLQGAHVATPCFACHVSEDRWTFKKIGTTCVDCHLDEHKNLLSDKYYPEKACLSCHSNNQWSEIGFNHSLTSWPLTGMHENLECKECHFVESDKRGTFKLDFIHSTGKCSSCHEDNHEDKYAENGVTVCTKCHKPQSWYPMNFDHNTTAFPLDGGHKNLDCNKCHKAEVNDNKKTIKFKIEKFECVDCHL